MHFGSLHQAVQLREMTENYVLRVFNYWNNNRTDKQGHNKKSNTAKPTTW